VEHKIEEKKDPYLLIQINTLEENYIYKA